MSESPQPTVTVGKTPEGQIVVETPQAIQPAVTRSWGEVYAWLGDPSTRYGRLVSDGRISVSVKLQMLRDPIIAFTMAYIASKLVKAEYEIRCADSTIKRFFEVMYAAFHQEFMLQASMAVAIGYCGLIKKLKFQIPQPEEPEEPPPWTSSTLPFIVAGFEQTQIAGSYPRFNKAGEFVGFTHAEGDVDRMYALWLTIGRTRAFGKYSGWGRLQSAYKAWWLSEFSDDLFVVHMQKNIDRVVEVSHPPGKTQDGEDYADVAMAIGDKARSGATITRPSITYSYTDIDGQAKMSNVPMWAVRFLEGTENVAAFIDNWDHFDSRKALGMLVPRQVHSGVRQEVFGGPTTARVLGQLAVDLILQEAVEIDQHLNEYVFPDILSWNFGPDAARVTKYTTGLNESDREELFKLLEALLNRESETARKIDPDALAHRLGVPTRELPPEEREEPAEEEEETEEPEEEAEPMLPPRRLFQIGDRYAAPGTHDSELVQETCPICGYTIARRYSDHGGLCVCENPLCGATFDPELE